MDLQFTDKGASPYDNRPKVVGNLAISQNFFLGSLNGFTIGLTGEFL